MSLKTRAMFKTVGVMAGLLSFSYAVIMIFNSLTASQIANAMSMGLLAFAMYCLYQYFLADLKNKEDKKNS